MVEADWINSETTGRYCHEALRPPPEIEFIDVLEAGPPRSELIVVIDQLPTHDPRAATDDKAAMVASQAKGKALEPEDYLL